MKSRTASPFHFALLLLALLLLSACEPPPTASPLPAQPTATQAQPPVNWEYKGVSLAGYWHDSYAQPNAYDTVDYLAETGATHVAVIVTWYQEDMQATQIFPRYEQETASDESLQTLIAYIHSKGMGVMLKPHLESRQGWLGNPQNIWRGVINPSDHAQWFQSYTQFILHYAQLAQQQGVELYTLGTEMASMTLNPEDQARWAALAAQVRAAYSGKLLYAGHEYEVMGGHYEKDGILFDFAPLPATFWQPFDYAGTTVYYSIQKYEQNNNPAPGADYLLTNWQTETLPCLARWQAGHGKPVLFAEIGYRSIDYAALNPYNVSGANRPDLTQNYNPTAQAQAYQAALQALSHTPWLAGAFWWQFIPSAASARECGQDVNPALEPEQSYTPCGKEAAQTLSQWYGGGNPSPPPAYAPTLPDLLDLPLLTEENLPRRWRAQTTGSLSFDLDAASLHLLTDLPCGDGRYAQLDYLFSATQNWSEYRSLNITARAAPNQHGELTVALLEADGTEWLSSHWLTGGEDWQTFSIALRAGADQSADPWEHPTEFVVAPWFQSDSTAPPYQLDLTQITGIRIKALAVNADCAALPQLETWIGAMSLSKEEVQPAQVAYLPVIETFNYPSQEALYQNWQILKSEEARANAVLDTNEGNPALWLLTEMPCEEPRYLTFVRHFPQPQDFSPYQTLSLRLRGDGENEAPWGAEFSLLLWDASGASEEIWQSSGWLDRKQGWSALEIRLRGSGQGNPFQHRNDFVIPTWEASHDNTLNLSQISAIGFRFNTTAESCAQFPQWEGWVDDFILK